MPDVTYVGKVQSIEEKKAGWHAIHIGVAGKQYPVKADTKLENLLKAVREIRDGDLIATFTVSESESENINPNNGKPYIERRLEKVEPGANGAPPASVREYTPDLKDRMIVRQTCLKAAAEIYSGIGFKIGATTEQTGSPDVPLDVMKAAQRFETWIYRDIEEAPFDEAGTPALSEHDDGIPFSQGRVEWGPDHPAYDEMGQ